jgi:hypothetical protein
VASTTYLSSGRRKPRRQRRTRWPLWAVLAIAFGALLVLLAGAAFGAIILHGRGELRNLNAFGARVDQVTLVGALRKAKPAGCTSKVSGPVTRPGGYRLPLADQVLVGAGVKKDVVVHTAFTLAGSAKAGCGFTVEVDVSATQLTPIASPTTVNPTTAPTGTTPPHHSLPPTDAPTLTPATSQATPPPAATSDCDPADPTCVVALDPDPLRAVG